MTQELTVYDLYIKVTEGKLDPDCSLNFPVDLWTFINVFSVQKNSSMIHQEESILVMMESENL